MHAGGGPWLGRYLERDTLRADGAFHRFATRRASDGRACVVVVPAPAVEREGAEKALRAFARAHATLVHPLVPVAEALAEHEGTLFVELACDATMDGTTILSRLIEGRHRLAYAEVEALTDALHDVLRAASAARDPETGEALALGRLSLTSLVAAPSGRFWLIGFGHRVATDDERGAIAVSQTVWQAPEVALGARPTPSGDFVAAWSLGRSLLPHVDVPEALARVLRGEGRDDDGPLVACLRELDASFIALPPDRRPAPDAGLALLAKARALLSVRPDPEGLARTISEIVLGLPLGGWDAVALHEPTEESVALAPDASWIDSGRGERLKLGPSLRGMLRLLLAHHHADPQRTASTWELLEAGWPGEIVHPEAGASRVYTSISRLRNMGLRSALERHDEGYRIVPLARLTLISD